MTSPEYYQKNKERILARTHERYMADKEKFLDYQREYRKTNRALVTAKTKAKRRARWDYAINLLGGCCSKCKQVFDSVCYDLHHVDPTQKEFTIGENMLVGKEKFEAEVKKCVLLCANCHRLEHKEIVE